VIAFAAAAGGLTPSGVAARRRRTPSDGELQAYVDGALDETRAAEVEAVLRRDPAKRRTVHLYRTLNHVVHLLYDDTVRQPIPQRLREALATQPRNRK
jgi:anti-sigma factor RsiW